MGVYEAVEFLVCGFPGRYRAGCFLCEKGQAGGGRRLCGELSVYGKMGWIGIRGDLEILSGNLWGEEDGIAGECYSE